MSRARLGEILIEAGLIDEGQLQQALDAQDELERPLGMTLVRLGMLDEATLIQTLARQLKLPMARLHGKRVDAQVLELMPIEVGDKYRCFPLFVKEEDDGRVLYLGMEDPSDRSTLEEVEQRVGISIRPVLVAPSELEEALHRHYHWMASGTAAAPLRAPGEAAGGDDEAAPLPPVDAIVTDPALEAPDAGPDDALGGLLDGSIDPSMTLGGDGPGALGESEFGPADDFGIADEPGPDLLGALADVEGVDEEPPSDPSSGMLALDSDADASSPEDVSVPDLSVPDLSVPDLSVPDLSEQDSSIPDLSVEDPAVPEAPPEPAAPAAAPAEISQEAILRALTQLLVEKGIITRDELVERVRQQALADGREAPSGA